MRVVLAGSFEPGAIAESYRRALTACGCTVSTFDFNAEPVRDRRLQWLRRRPLIGGLLEDKVLEQLNYELSDRLHQERPDLLLTNNGTFLLPGTLAAARQYGCATANLWGEPLLHLNRWNIIPSLPFYDVVFAFDRAQISALERAGASRVEHLPLAWDPHLHPGDGTFTGAELARFQADLVFIGKWSPDRERRLTPLAHHDLAIWGDRGWKDLTAPGSPLRSRWRGRPVVGREYALACAAAKICLNLVEPAAQESANMRTFELAGMGRFVLAPRNQAHEELFVEGEEIELFSTPEELRAKVERYLTQPTEREAIGRAARRKVAAQHTYEHRARRIVEAIEGRARLRRRAA